MKGKVTISHAFCLGSPDQGLIEPLLVGLAEQEIAIMTTAMPSATVPSVGILLLAGVRVCSGSDGIRDTWAPFGNADMLQRAQFICMKNRFRRDVEIDKAVAVCTYGGAEVMGLKEYGIQPGCRADLVLVPGQCIAEAVVTNPPRTLVIKRGQIVARNGLSLRRAP